MGVVSKTLTAENTFTDALYVRGLDPVLGRGLVDLEITGTFSGAIYVQFSADGSTWNNTGDVYTTAGARLLERATGCYLRAGFPTGAFTSGSAAVALRQGA